MRALHHLGFYHKFSFAGSFFPVLALLPQGTPHTVVTLMLQSIFGPHVEHKLLRSDVFGRRKEEIVIKSCNVLKKKKKGICYKNHSLFCKVILVPPHLLNCVPALLAGLLFPSASFISELRALNVVFLCLKTFPL